MQPFILTRIPQEDVVLFEKVRDAVNKLPELDLGTDDNGEPIIFSCHILARAIGIRFGLAVGIGFYHPHFEHSWALTRNENIIDLYPVATLGGPILVDKLRPHIDRTYIPNREVEKEIVSSLRTAQQKQAIKLTVDTLRSL